MQDLAVVEAEDRDVADVAPLHEEASACGAHHQCAAHDVLNEHDLATLAVDRRRKAILVDL